MDTVDASALNHPFDDGGEAGRMMRALDWAAHPLGPMARWTPSFRTIIEVILAARQPMFAIWGPELRLFYNDAYGGILGARHPAAMGRPFAEVWSDIWDNIAPMFRRCLAGEATFYENLHVPIVRGGAPEDAWFSFSHTPLRDVTGAVIGLFCVSIETTAEMVARRRMRSDLDQLKQMFDQAPGFMALLNGPDHRLMLSNRAHQRLVGPRAIQGAPLAEALPELVEQGYLDLLDKTYRDNEALVAQGAVYVPPSESGKEQEARVVDFVFQPLTDATGAVRGIFIEGSDVTERARAEKDLLEARARAEQEATERAAILEHLAEAVIVTDVQGRISYVNLAATRLLGTDLSQTEPPFEILTVERKPYPEQDFPLARAVRGETAAESRWRIRRNDGFEILAIGAARPILSREGNQIGAVLTFRDDTAREAIERQLRENEARLRTLTDNLPSGMIYQVQVDSDWTDRRFTYVSQNCLALTGVSAEELMADPQTAADLILPEFREAVGKAREFAFLTRSLYDVEFRMRRRDGEIRWFRLISKPGRSDGEATIWDGLMIDISDQKDAEARLQLLIDELNHRVKNTLATVQAIAVQTFRDPVGMDASRIFQARLLAMAQAHDVLTRANWTGAMLHDLVARALEPLGDPRRARASGPRAALPPRTALALAMALHELGTNAAKYGALSTADGTIEISWEYAVPDPRLIEQAKPAADPSALRFVWCESNGPPVIAPSHSGFGTRLVEQALLRDLGGKVRVLYEPAGVRCLIDRLPMSQRRDRDDALALPAGSRFPA